jgi:circadian clock protein KaiC
MTNSTRNKSLHAVPKTPTGIEGLDTITGGGLPRGRTSLIAGGPGSGKTLFGLEFLLHGAERFGEPGVAMTFEETPEELEANIASLGHDLKAMERSGKISIDYVEVERRQIEEVGPFDLEGLFVRLDYAISQIKAKRVLLDTIEVLFSGFTDEGTIRSELRRLFRWLKDRGVTAVVTAESGVGSFVTRHGLEEYVADCVIVLDQRVTDQISTRRIRVLKYRGSAHGTNEYPFLIGERGLSVLPITSVGLTHGAPSERISSGVDGLDEMLGGRGFYRASSVLVSGNAGTGKSILAAMFANAACDRGEKALCFAFEESPPQILRNMKSVGVDLAPHLTKKRLLIHSVRPTSTGLEAHLASMHQLVNDFAPDVVVVDPITNLISVGSQISVKAMLTRLIDFLKIRGITAVFTNLSMGNEFEQTSTEISSLMDSWLMLRNQQVGANRERLLNVLKSRGMAHSSEIRQFLISDSGIQINSERMELAAVGQED